MSAARNHLPSGDKRTSWGIALTPPHIWVAGPPMLRAMPGGVAPGVGIWLRSMVLISLVASASTTMRSPLNSQVTTIVVRSALKSAWLTPPHGSGSRRTSCMVWASRTTIACSRSAMVRAYLPSGEK